MSIAKAVSLEHSDLATLFVLLVPVALRHRGPACPRTQAPPAP